MADDTTVVLDAEDQGVADLIDDVIGGLQTDSEKLDAIVAGVIGGFNLLTNEVKDLSSALQSQLSPGFQEPLEGGKDLETELENLEIAASDLEDTIDTLQDDLAILAEENEELTGKVSSLEASLQALQQQLENSASELSNLGSKTDNVADDLDDLADEADDASHEVRGLESAVDSADSTMSGWGSRLKGIASSLASMFVIDLTQLPNLLKDVGEKLFGNTEQWEQAQESVTNLLAVLGNALLPILESAISGFEFVTSILQKSSGVINRVANNFVDFAETGLAAVIPLFQYIGEVALNMGARISVVWNWVTEMSTALWSGLTNIFTAITEVFGAAGLSGQSMGEMLGNAFNFIGDTASVSFAFLQTVIENWQLSASAAAAKFAYNAVVAFENVKYFFTDVFPAALGWFGENWQAIFTDAGNFLGNVLSNMGTNIKNFFTAVMSWLQGDGFDFRFVGLMEGFKATVEAFPEIADRQRSVLEDTLGAMADSLGQEFSDRLSQRIIDNEQQFLDARQSIADFLSADPIEMPVTIEDVEVPEVPERVKIEAPKGTDVQTPVGPDEGQNRGAVDIAGLANSIQDSLLKREENKPPDPTPEIQESNKLLSGIKQTLEQKLSTVARYTIE